MNGKRIFSILGHILYGALIAPLAAIAGLLFEAWPEYQPSADEVVDTYARKPDAARDRAARFREFLRRIMAHDLFSGGQFRHGFSPG